MAISAEERKGLFRLTVYNFLAGNTDDHSRNFSFLMAKDGKWHVAPAYGLMITIDLNNELYGSFHSKTLGGGVKFGCKHYGFVAVCVRYHLGTSFPSYVTNEGLRVTNFRIKENDRHDFELWAVIENKPYRYLVDGELKLGQSIKQSGSYQMSIDNKIKLLQTYLVPKAMKNK